MKKTLINLILLTLILITPQLTQAQEASDSSTTTAATTTTASPSADKTTQELKERIQRIVEEKSEQIKGAIDQLSQNKRGFIGQVSRVTEESLTITNRKGTEIIPVSEEIVLLKNNKEISVDEIAVDDWLIVMGLITDDSFAPKRILVSSASLRPKNHFVSMGTIIDQSSKEITILSRQNEEITFNINSKTEFQDKSGDTVKKTEFIQDLQVLIVGDEDDTGKNASIIKSLVQLEAIQNNE